MRSFTHYLAGVLLFFATHAFSQSPPDSVYVQFLPADITVGNGGSVSLDVTVDSFISMVGMQFDVDYDPAVLQYVNATNVNSNLVGTQFSLINPGQLRVLWNDFSLQPKTLPNGATLFTVNFTAVGASCSSTDVTIDDDGTVEFVYYQQGPPTIIINLPASTTPSTVNMTCNCGITNVESGSDVSFICQTETAGPDNDEVVIEIDYTGSDPAVVVTNNGAGTVGGDDPATVPNGTIIISDIFEGEMWDIDISGGDCSLNSSGTVPSNLCGPTPCGITDLETGNEANIICFTGFMGPGNDSVRVEVDYLGVDPAATITNNGSGTIGGDDPATVKDGTIVISGLFEGDSWNFSITGGNCNLQSSGMVDSLECNPLFNCGVTSLQTGNQVSFSCLTNTTGADNDTVVIEIDYTGSDSNAVVINSGGGTIGGDDPASVPNGTITVSGLREGDSWNISISGGACNLTSMGTVPSNHCDPPPCGITNLETGNAANFICSTNTTGPDNDDVTIEIDYTGSDPNATITNNGGGTIGGDDPASVPDGTITITGLGEGDSWNISITGGECDLTSTGTVPSMECDPSCGITNLESGTDAEIVCLSNTFGPDNDDVRIEIDYTGSDPNATITNNGGGTLGGDDPASVSNGTITITGLQEGDSWNISITGGGCDLTSTGSVPSTHCDPQVCMITNLETGNQINIVCLTRTTGSDNDGVRLEIDYTGMDPNATVTNNGGGTIGGDDPASVPDGTITITGLGEGDSWNISITGGACNLTSTGTIGSDLCEPVNCGITALETGNQVNIVCLTQTSGADNDDVRIEIDYTGSHPGVSVVNNGGGAISGDDPASVPDGTIIINGLGEGDNWNISITGGPCNLNSTGTVGSNLCDGGGICGVTDLETGVDVNFLCVTNTTFNNDEIIVEIGYTGSDPNATVINNGPGTIGGDDPATTPNGIITISNVNEGDSWNISITGGGCDLNSAGNIPSNACTPSTSSDSLVLFGSDESGMAGEQVCVEVSVENFFDMISFQFSVNWNANVARFDSVGGFNIPFLENGSFGKNQTNNGILTVGWFSDSQNNPITVPDGTIIFKVYFTILGGGGSSTPVSFTGTPTPIDAVRNDGQIQQIGVIRNAGSITSTGGSNDLFIDISDATGQPGDTVCVDFTVQNFNNIAGIQYSMNWDPAVLKYAGVRNINLSGLTPGSFNLVGNDALVLQWLDPAGSGVSLPSGTVIYSVCFEIVGNLGDMSDVEITDDPTMIQVVRGGVPPEVIDVGTSPGKVTVQLPPMDPVIVSVDCPEGDPGDEVCFPVTVENFEALVAAQFTMHWDPTLLQWGRLQNLNATLNLSQGGNFGTPSNPNIPDGTLTFLWTDLTLTPRTLADGETLFEVCLDVIGQECDSNRVFFNGMPTAVLFVNGNNNQLPTQLNECQFVVGPCAGEFSIRANITNASCFDECDGAIDLVISGGDKPYTVDWDVIPGTSNPEDLSNLCAGTYNVTVTDQLGETIDTSFTITQPGELVINSEVTNAGCVSQDDGSITINVSGGSGNYSYTWDTPGLSGCCPTGLSPGTYCVTVTDNANNCTVEECFDVGVTTPLDIDIDSTNILCNGNCTGSISITVSGGSGVYTYTWDPPATNTPNRSDLCAGTYTVTITDINSGCFNVETIEITEPDPLVITVDSSSNPECSGDANGCIYTTITGGTPPFTFAWRNSQGQNVGNMADNCNLPAGTFILTVTDVNGCTRTTNPINLVDPPAIVITGDVTNPDQGQSNGAVDVSVSGGAGGFTYLWSHGPATQDVSGLAPGVYCVTATDSDGCENSECFDVFAPLMISQINVTNVDCFGDSTGAIQLIVMGGKMPYTFVWSPPLDSVSNPGGLQAGTYSVTVIDDLGNTDVSPAIMVQQPAAPLGISNSVINPDDGSGNGSINITATGGTPDYSYEWSHGPMSQDVFNLDGDNNYEVTITDEQGCTFVQSFFLPLDPIPLEIMDVTINDVSCYGEQDGSIFLDMIPSPGQPYTFRWVGKPGNDHDVCADTCFVQNPSNLPKGTYCVIVTDRFDQVLVDSFEVEEPDSLTISIDEVIGLRCPDKKGVIRTTVSGGTPPYTYEWSTGQTAPDPEDFEEGEKQVTVTDANGCIVVSEMVEVPGLPPCPCQVEIDNVLCHGDETGSIQVGVCGGNAPYSFHWENEDGDTLTGNNTIVNLGAGNYFLTITDAGGMTQTAVYTVFEPNPLGLTANIDPSDNGDDGRIALTITGGTPQYTVNWDDGGTGRIRNGLAPGIYCATITDANDCTIDTCVAVNGAPVVDYIVTNENCTGDRDGTIELIINGIGPFTINWDDGNTDLVRTGLAPGTYTVVVTDANNLVGTATIIVATNSFLSASASVVSQPTFPDSDDGVAEVVAVNGGQPYSYIWCNGSTADIAFNLEVGICLVQVTDAFGCVAFDTVELKAPSIPVTFEFTQPTCRDDCDARAEIIHQGGRGPFTYQWSDPAGQTGPVAIELCPQTYFVTITDSKGYSEVKEVEVENSPGIQVDFVTVPAVQNDGEIEAFPFGGQPPYFFQWSNGETTPRITGLDPGEYTLTVFDAIGCVTETSIVLAGQTDCGLVRNVISPNQDGRNDEFIINCAEFTENNIQIFDRWGQLIFEQDNYQNNWRGTDLDGEDVPEGGYFYVFEYLDNGITRQVKGSITVLR